MGPDTVLSEVYVNAGDPGAQQLGLTADTDAKVTRYADGRVIIAKYQRGTAGPDGQDQQVGPPQTTYDIDQVKSYKELNPSQQEAKPPARTAEQAQLDAELARQRAANQAAGIGYVTDAEARQIQQQQATQQRQTEQDARQAAADQAAAQQRASAEQRAQSAETRAQTSFEQQQAERTAPQVISAPTNQPNIAMRDPTTGEITSQPNPNYDAALAQSQKMKEDLALQIQMGQLTSQQAAQQYKQWFDSYVQIPQMQAEEARARAAEIRAAQQAEDQRQRFAADYERQRQTEALGYGQNAARLELEKLPYMVGPEFSSQMASAINSLARGSSAGVNFTSDAFAITPPDYQEVAKNATAQALKDISPLAQSMVEARPLQVADYSGVPNLAAVPPPAPPQPVDLQALLNQAQGQ